MFSSESQAGQHYRLGVVGVSLFTRIRRIREAYDALYSRHRTVVAPPSAIRVEVRRMPIRPWRRPRYEVLINGRSRFQPTSASEILPFVEWGVNWELARTHPQFLQLHAASVEYQGAGVVLAAESGSGKSTLTLALLRRGWRYFCDEFALVHADTSLLHPFPRGICIKQSGFGLAESLGIPVAPEATARNALKGVVQFVSPFRAASQPVATPCPIRHVVFPRFVAGAAPSLSPIPRAEAAMELHRVCFNVFGCQRQALDVVVRILRSANCFRLITGDLHSTCELLESAVLGENRREFKIA